MITVTTGEWAASDLPASAIEYYAFIGAEIFKIPAEYRDGAPGSSMKSRLGPLPTLSLLPGSDLSRLL
ncbi:MULTISPECIES: hypothetical protein [Pseudomonas syringae group]|uniref:hypothetical protein n=1 Tax=Pseudomonas syringae group TaxID=136849 RepID=UPI000EFF485B|nr:hypothetical protein [Pseudomonas syringae group genomosp. 3]